MAPERSDRPVTATVIGVTTSATFKLTKALYPVVIAFYNTILENYFITANAREAAVIDNGSAGPG